MLIFKENKLKHDIKFTIIGKMEQKKSKTTLEKKVYRYLRLIPGGKVATYSQIAQAVATKNHARVVGNILHENDDPDFFPCYKVVNAKGCLARHFGLGISEQKARLSRDGIEIIEGNEIKIDLSRYQWDDKYFHPHEIRRINQQDNEAVENLIRYCLVEYEGDREGTAWFDDLGNFYETYDTPSSGYYVAVNTCGELIACGGFAPVGGMTGTCELQKFYCMPNARGSGIAAEVFECIIANAKKQYGKMILETFSNMERAKRFYEKHGFRKCEKSSIGKHPGCDTFYELDLQ